APQRNDSIERIIFGHRFCRTKHLGPVNGRLRRRPAISSLLHETPADRVDQQNSLRSVDLYGASWTYSGYAAQRRVRLDSAAHPAGFRKPGRAILEKSGFEGAGRV